jgi:hypothetical protein
MWGQQLCPYLSEVLHKQSRVSKSLVVMDNLIAISSLFRSFLPYMLPQILLDVCVNAGSQFVPME